MTVNIFKSGKRHFSWMNPKLEVQETEKYGKGVFATEDIKKDEILAIFGGYVMPVKKEEDLPADMGDYGLQISEDFVLGIKERSEISDTDFFNHSCDPNAGFKGQIFLVAMRNIKKGEEILFDYAMVLHKVLGAKPYVMECECSSRQCRKFITEDDWKKNELQEKYDGYFQFYLQEKIDTKNQ